MSQPDQKPEFTIPELRLIFRKLREDAIREGYGVRYHAENKSEWPDSMRKLVSVANKIHKVRDWIRDHPPDETGTPKL